MSCAAPATPTTLLAAVGMDAVPPAPGSTHTCAMRCDAMVMVMRYGDGRTLAKCAALAIKLQFHAHTRARNHFRSHLFTAKPTLPSDAKSGDGSRHVLKQRQEEWRMEVDRRKAVGVRCGVWVVCGVYDGQRCLFYAVYTEPPPPPLPLSLPLFCIYTRDSHRRVPVVVPCSAK